MERRALSRVRYVEEFFHVGGALCHFWQFADFGLGLSATHAFVSCLATSDVLTAYGCWRRALSVFSRSVNGVDLFFLAHGVPYLGAYLSPTAYSNPPPRPPT